MNRKKPIARLTPLKPRLQAIPKVSKKQAARIRKYAPIAKEFRERNDECQVRSPDCIFYTSSVHHGEGKEGDLLFDDSKFVASCAPCHLWAETHPSEAKALGISLNRLVSNE